MFNNDNEAHDLLDKSYVHQKLFKRERKKDKGKKIKSYYPKPTEYDDSSLEFYPTQVKLI